MRTIVLLQTTAWSAAAARVTELGAGAREGVGAASIALAIVVLGWTVATLGSALVRVVLRASRFDDGVRRVLGANIVGRHEPAVVVAWLVQGLVLLAAVVLALEVLGFRLSASVAARLTEVVPRIVTSAVLFSVGSLIALLTGAITRRFLEKADVRLARLHGQVVGVVLTGFSALLALEQLGFAAQFVMGIGVAAIATAGLGLALAFGLGCRDLARDFVVEYVRSLDDSGPRPSE